MLVEALTRAHNRLAFSCGNDRMDRYLHEIAHQAKRKGLAATFVAVEPGDDPAKILGYYSLSSFMIAGVDIPAVMRKKRGIPQHTVGATLLGRLAVDSTCQGRGVGSLLVADALRRAYLVSGDVASVCVVADALDEARVAFYRQFGFEQLEPGSLRLVLMMDSVAQLLPGTAMRIAQDSSASEAG